MTENPKPDQSSPQQPIPAAGEAGNPTNACPCCGQPNIAPFPLCQSCGAALSRLNEFRYTVRRAVVLGILLIGLSLTAWFKGMNLFILLLMTPAVLLFLIWLSIGILSIFKSAGAIQKSMDSMSQDQLRRFALAYRLAQTAGGNKLSPDMRIGRPLLAWAVYTGIAAIILVSVLLPMRSFHIIEELTWQKIACLAIAAIFLTGVYSFIGYRYGRALAGKLVAWACCLALATLITLTLTDLLPK